MIARLTETGLRIKSIYPVRIYGFAKSVERS